MIGLTSFRSFLPFYSSFPSSPSSQHLSSSSPHSHSVFGSKLPSKVTICEVGARDGLQNEKVILPTNVKLELLSRLRASGLKYIEATSFVSSRWVPQMADSKQIMDHITSNDDGGVYSVLVPNLQGCKNALSCGSKALAFFTAASESFCKKNMNCTIDASFASFESCLPLLPPDAFIRGYISCVLGCPFEGPIEVEKVAEVALRLLRLGCHEISLGDTIGRGTAGETARMLESVLSVVPVEKVAVHFHDTYGQALANILVSLQVREFYFLLQLCCVGRGEKM
jgi:isopropylmalate/homocitrate/citramalate synthase